MWRARLHAHTHTYTYTHTHTYVHTHSLTRTHTHTHSHTHVHTHSHTYTHTRTHTHTHTYHTHTYTHTHMDSLWRYDTNVIIVGAVPWWSHVLVWGQQPSHQGQGHWERLWTHAACRWETVVGEMSWKWCIANSAFLRTSSLCEQWSWYYHHWSAKIANYQYRSPLVNVNWSH